MIRGIRCLSVGAAMAMLVACGNRPEQYVLPSQVMDFGVLYKDNCAGCHGQNGRHGAARPLNDPLYLALAGKEKLRNVIANGVPRTSMPAFAIKAGGTLTDQQVAILADQIEARWSQPGEFAGVDLPPYSAEPRRPGARQGSVRGVLLAVPRRWRNARIKGRAGCKSGLSRTGQRPVPPDNGNRRTRRSRHPETGGRIFQATR